VLVAVCVAPVATADTGQGGAGGQGRRASPVEPATSFQGAKGPELLAEYFSELLSLPPADNPLAGNGEGCLRLGENGRILSPVNGGTRTTVNCRVEASRPIFLVTSSVDCSSAEDAPFHAEGAAEQIACAREQFAEAVVPFVESVLVTVDGGAPVQLRDERFAIFSAQGETVFPDNAIFEPSAGGPATFAAGAWAAKVHGLSRGPHTIVVHYTFADVTGLDDVVATFNLDAV